MLQRQQAGAIIEARGLIVEGAVSMVQMALDKLSSRGIVDLDEKRKATMVNNLLVVLCSDHSTQPVLNACSRNPQPERRESRQAFAAEESARRVARVLLRFIPTPTSQQGARMLQHLFIGRNATSPGQSQG